MTDHLTDNHVLAQHEVADRLYVLTETLAAHLLDHPFVIQRPVILKHLQAGLDELSTAYQAVGNATPGDVELGEGA